ncbi:hypothetical protein FRC12_009321 [Ceratobasidium sp. 428]|nr:hypothetical protein FRC12_009321 [Ceratobasidium sp. 428]
MQPFSCFRIQGILCHIDYLGRLWFYYPEDSIWYLALVYASIADALSQSLELFQPLRPVDNDTAPTAMLGDNSNSTPGPLWADFEQHIEQITVNLPQADVFNQHISPIHNPSNSSDIAVLNESFVDETNIPVNPSIGNVVMALDPLLLLNATPSQEEVEVWLRQYQLLRRTSKTQEGLAKIICPLPGCGRVLRRLHALRLMNALCATSASKPSPTAIGICKAGAPLRNQTMIQRSTIMMAEGSRLILFAPGGSVLYASHL